MFRRFLLCSVWLMGAAAATPAPIAMSHAGRLFDGDDVPVNRPKAALAFSVWDDPEGELPVQRLWPSGGEASCVVDVIDGHYAVSLGGGCGPELTTEAMPLGAPRFLQVSFDGVVLRPRLRIGTAPTAGVAGEALDARGLGGLAREGFWEKSQDLASATAGASTLGARLDDAASLTRPNVFASSAKFGAAGDETLVDGGRIVAERFSGRFSGDGTELVGLGAARLGDAQGPTLAEALAAPLSGDGSGITRLNTNAVRAELPATLARTDSVNRFAPAQAFGQAGNETTIEGGVVKATSFRGAFFGDGAGLTRLDGDAVRAQLPESLARRDAENRFLPAQSFGQNGNETTIDGGTVEASSFRGAFFGDGSGLTRLDGEAVRAQLPESLARMDAPNRFLSVQAFGPAGDETTIDGGAVEAVSFRGAFFGDGSGLTRLDGEAVREHLPEGLARVDAANRFLPVQSFGQAGDETTIDGGRVSAERFDGAFFGALHGSAAKVWDIAAARLEGEQGRTLADALAHPSGDGSGITKLDAEVVRAALPANLAMTDLANAFSAPQSFVGAGDATTTIDGGTVRAGRFEGELHGAVYGSGAGLTELASARLGGADGPALSDALAFPSGDGSGITRLNTQAVRAELPGTLARTDAQNEFAVVQTFVDALGATTTIDGGTVRAGRFEGDLHGAVYGDASGLTHLASAYLGDAGSWTLSQALAHPSGDGSGITKLDTQAVRAELPSTLAMTELANAFTAAQTFVASSGGTTTIDGGDVTADRFTGEFLGPVRGSLEGDVYGALYGAVHGSGAGLTNLSSARLGDGNSRTLADALASPSGDGSGLTKLDTQAVRAELPPTLARTDLANAFTTVQTFVDDSGATTIEGGTVRAERFEGRFLGSVTGDLVGDVYGSVYGSGAGLTQLAGARLADNSGPTLSHVLAHPSGDGAGLTNLSASALATGTVPAARLPANLAKTDAANVFAPAQTFGASGSRTVIDGGAVTAQTVSASHAGDGSGLFNLNASALQTGSVAAGLLPSNLAKTDGANVFSAPQAFGAQVMATGDHPQLTLSGSGHSYLALNRASTEAGEIGIQWRTAGGTNFWLYQSPGDDQSLRIHAAGADRLSVRADGEVRVPGTVKAGVVAADDLRAGSQRRAFRSFVVPGAVGRYYPVWFDDGCWDDGETELVVQRSNVHEDQPGRGAMFFKVRYNGSQWGHGSDYYETFYRGDGAMVGQWGGHFIRSGWGLWLRGGDTTYHYWSSCPTSPLLRADSIESPLNVYENAAYPQYNYVMAPRDTIDAGVRQGRVSSH